MRLSKIKLFTAIFLVTLTFLVFQLLIVNYLKSIYNKSENSEADVRFDNPRFQVLKLRTITTTTVNSLKPFPTIEQLNSSHLIAEIRVPLEKDNRPSVFHMLPFHHKKNFFDFETILVKENENKMVFKDEKVKIRGVNKQKVNLYLPDAQGMFKCLNSNQRIEYIKLNDDYCDCVDATDEPGTSACQFSTFYCSTQDEYLQDNFIPSSRVDDRFCDCCDGSDESQVKCPNRCQELIDKGKQDLRIKQMAVNEKQKYLVDGIFKNEKLYGPQGVFYRLSLTCLDIKWSDYTFEVCPYKRVTQFKPYSNGKKTNLGTDSALVLGEISNKKIWILKMGNGDREFCPQPRESEIRYICGIENKLISVQEPQKCVYLFELQTPAAC